MKKAKMNKVLVLFILLFLSGCIIAWGNGLGFVGNKTAAFWSISCLGSGLIVFTIWLLMALTGEAGTFRSLRENCGKTLSPLAQNVFIKSGSEFSQSNESRHALLDYDDHHLTLILKSEESSEPEIVVMEKRQAYFHWIGAKGHSLNRFYWFQIKFDDKSYFLTLAITVQSERISKIRALFRNLSEGGYPAEGVLKEIEKLVEGSRPTSFAWWGKISIIAVSLHVCLFRWIIKLVSKGPYWFAGGYESAKFPSIIFFIALVSCLLILIVAIWRVILMNIFKPISDSEQYKESQPHKNVKEASAPEKEVVIFRRGNAYFTDQWAHLNYAASNDKTNKGK
ncbi:MAG: hypothetical protein JEZ02_06535 [Desulfatibacillum sp.]|nr:hypothetical protein [Desulfatibacillum sp.]